MWLSRLFPLFGVPFMLIGAGGIARAALTMLPGSPYYDLEIGAEGPLLRALFRQRRFAWRDLPPFETLERRRNTKNGVGIQHCTVAMQSAPPEPDMKPGATYQREVLRILADEYGAKNGPQDAEELAAWFNQLREVKLARDEAVTVPPAFQESVLPDIATGKLGLKIARPPTVVRR
ncbi:MAG: hypothetical protein ACREEP_07060 [Dongiaceae bacterium]